MISPSAASPLGADNLLWLNTTVRRSLLPGGARRWQLPCVQAQHNIWQKNRKKKELLEMEEKNLQKEEEEQRLLLKKALE